MANYYCRQDGTATIANAIGVNGQTVGSTGAAADNTKCASVATVNTGTGLVAGDTVWFSSQGGAFTTTALNPTKSGVTYRAVTGESPTFTLSATCLQANVSTLVFDGFTLNANVVGGAVAVGTVSDITLRNMTISNPNATGYGIRSTSSWTNLTVENTTISAALVGISVSTNACTGLTLTNVTITADNLVSLSKITNMTIRRFRGFPYTSAGAVVNLYGCRGTLDWKGGYIQQGTTATSCGIMIYSGSSGQVPSYTNGVIQDVVVFAYDTGIQTGELDANNSLSFLRCKVIGMGGAAGVGNGFRIYNASNNVTLVDCEAWWVAGDGFDVAGDKDGTRNVKFYNCRAMYCGLKSVTASGDGFSAHNDSSGTVMENCLAVGNLFSGVHHVGSSSGVMRNCLFQNNGDAYGTPSGESNMELTTSGAWTITNTISSGGYPIELRAAAKANIATANCVFHPLTPAASVVIASGADAGTMSVAGWKTATGDGTTIDASPGIDSLGTPAQGGNCWYGTGLPGLRTVGQIGSGITPSIELIGPGAVEAPLMRREC